MASGRNDNNRIEIPDECRRVKADFPTRPSDAIIREIKQFIAGTGKPYLWRGHSHTKPLPGSKPIYLDEFDLPLSFLNGGHLAPCPCCWPNHPKYGRQGKIAWFPSEGVIRLLGPDCFAAMDQSAHAEALAEMRREKKRKQDIAYLFRNKESLRRLPAVFERAAEIGAAIDQLKTDLSRTFVERLNIPIWEQVRTGKLQVWEDFRDIDRQGDIQTLTRLRDYASIDGIAVLRPEVKTFAFRAKQFIDNPALNEHQGWQVKIDSLEDQERHQIATLVNRTVINGRRLLADITEAQGFVSDLNLTTMKNWAARPDCPEPFHLEKNGNVLMIGRRSNAMFKVHIGPAIYQELLQIEVPTLKEMPEDVGLVEAA